MKGTTASKAPADNGIMSGPVGTIVRVLAIIAALWTFLLGLALMGDAFKALAGDSAGSMFEDVNTPIAGLMIGIVATVLVQSSSTSTSIVVAMVGSGILDVNQAIPIIMGANIGTSVTNTIVSLGFVGNPECYERGFAGATVHDLFNYLSVITLLPIEMVTNWINGGDGGLLQVMTKAMVGDTEYEKGEKPAWSPTKKAVSPVSKELIAIDKDVIKDWSQGAPTLAACDSGRDLCADFVSGDNSTSCGAFKFNTKTPEACAAAALATCSSAGKASFTYCLGDGAVNTTVMDSAQAYYDDLQIVAGGAFKDDLGMSNTGSGWFALVLSLVLLCLALFFIIKLLQIMVQGKAEVWLKRAFNMNDYLAILVGAGITVMVQSSSITTSTLVPLVAVGALELKKMLPLTLGANIGTTGTALLAATVSGKAEAVQIALCHLFFNIFGILIWFPVPYMRSFPLRGAMFLGRMAAAYKTFPVVYTLLAFIVYPMILLGMFMLLAESSAGLVAVGGILAALFLAVHASGLYWWKKKGGRDLVMGHVEARLDVARANVKGGTGISMTGTSMTGTSTATAVV